MSRTAMVRFPPLKPTDAVPSTVLEDPQVVAMQAALDEALSDIDESSPGSGSALPEAEAAERMLLRAIRKAREELPPPPPDPAEIAQAHATARYALWLADLFERRGYVRFSHSELIAFAADWSKRLDVKIHADPRGSKAMLDSSTQRLRQLGAPVPTHWDDELEMVPS